MFVSVFNFEFGVDLWSRVSPPALLSVHGGIPLVCTLGAAPYRRSLGGC